MKIKLRKIKYKFFLLKEIILEKIYKLEFIQKPFPKEPFGKELQSNKTNYLKLHKKAISKKSLDVSNFENELGYAINDEWFSNLCLTTQTCIKKSELNYNHGRILYSLVSKYINCETRCKNNFTFLETGTARGFSSICMSKALNDSKLSGKIITIDCISHLNKIYWNCIKDFEGKRSREELLKDWEEELSNIIFIQGWTLDVLKNLHHQRINFAFLDAQHTKESVLEEFKYIEIRQKKGDIIFFDDVTPELFEGVCSAVKYIDKNYSYKLRYLDFDNQRGYAYATKI